MNDGAAVMVLVNEEKLKELKLTPLARIVSYADAEQAPEWFTTTPAIAVPRAVAKAGLKMQDIDYWELNEAFAVVGIENSKRHLDPAKVNIHGGAVSPASAGMVVHVYLTLLHILKQQSKMARPLSVTGNGASAMVIENLL